MSNLYELLLKFLKLFNKSVKQIQIVILIFLILSLKTTIFWKTLTNVFVQSSVIVCKNQISKLSTGIKVIDMEKHVEKSYTYINTSTIFIF